MNPTGKRLITEKIADSLSRFRDIDTRLDSDRLHRQLDLGAGASDDELTDDDDEDDDDETDQHYATLSKVNSGLLKTTNSKSVNGNGTGSLNGSVNGVNGDERHSSKNEIWLEYGCI